ncbi:unnamed protein product, partial [Ectocarpus sp. 12 AP-2014]
MPPQKTNVHLQQNASGRSWKHSTRTSELSPRSQPHPAVALAALAYRPAFSPAHQFARRQNVRRQATLQTPTASAMHSSSSSSTVFTQDTESTVLVPPPPLFLHPAPRLERKTAFLPNKTKQK